MPELHVRNISPSVHERLREQARTQGRSMSAEAATILHNALGSHNSAAGRNAAIEQLRDIQRTSRLPVDAPSSEEMTREDRDEAV